MQEKLHLNGKIKNYVKGEPDKGLSYGDKELITALIALKGEKITHTLNLDSTFIPDCGEGIYKLQVSSDGSAEPFRHVYKDQVVGSALRVVSLILKEMNTIDVTKIEIDDLKQRAIRGRWWKDDDNLFQHPLFLDTMQRMTLNMSQ